MRGRTTLVVCAIAAGSFAYGFAAGKFEIFPHDLIRVLTTRDWRAHFATAPTERVAEPARDETIARLEAIGYVQGYMPAPERSGVTVNEPLATQPGLNFFASAHAPVATLMDMEGNPVHQWSREVDEIWDVSLLRDADFWERAQIAGKVIMSRLHLFRDGSLLAVFSDLGLVKLDKDSEVVWAYKGRAHHDLDVLDDGRIFVLTRARTQIDDRFELLSWERADGKILEDFITVLSPDGREIRSVSLLRCFLNSDFASMLEHFKRDEDVFHSNTIEVIRPEVAERFPMFEAGQVLVSMRNIHALAVIDLEAERVTWAMTGMWKYQHHPTPLANGHLLIFDNYGGAGHSRILELDPATQRVAWRFVGAPPESFYTPTNGMAHRLANGNTLISETDAGRAFEVTATGRIVWEYVNPKRVGASGENIAAIYDMQRLAPETLDFLGGG